MTIPKKIPDKPKSSSKPDNQQQQQQQPVQQELIQQQAIQQPTQQQSNQQQLIQQQQPIQRQQQQQQQQQKQKPYVDEDWILLRQRKVEEMKQKIIEEHYRITFHVENQAMQVQIGKSIGKGTFGEVFEAMIIAGPRQGELVAVKQVILQGSLPQIIRLREDLQKEHETMSKLQHPNIVQLYGFSVQQNKIYLVMELVAGRSLDDIIHNMGPFRESVCRQYMKQLLIALRYCHDERKVWHRDLKSRNILLTNTGQIKLADFGSAKTAELQAYAVTDTYAYTPSFIAPEVLTHQHYTSGVDIWAVGCCLVEWSSGRDPWNHKYFENIHSLIYHIGKKKDRPRGPAHLSDEALHFLDLCFQFDPKKRPTAAQLLHHPFITKPYNPEHSRAHLYRDKQQIDVDLKREENDRKYQYELRKQQIIMRQHEIACQSVSQSSSDASDTTVISDGSDTLIISEEKNDISNFSDDEKNDDTIIEHGLTQNDSKYGHSNGIVRKLSEQTCDRLQTMSPLDEPMPAPDASMPPLELAYPVSVPSSEPEIFSYPASTPAKVPYPVSKPADLSYHVPVPSFRAAMPSSSPVHLPLPPSAIPPSSSSSSATPSSSAPSSIHFPLPLSSSIPSSSPPSSEIPSWSPSPSDTPSVPSTVIHLGAVPSTPSIPSLTPVRLPSSQYSNNDSHPSPVSLSPTPSSPIISNSLSSVDLSPTPASPIISNSLSSVDLSPTPSSPIMSNSLSSVDLSPTPPSPIISNSMSSIEFSPIPSSPLISNTVSSIATTDSNISLHSSVSSVDQKLDLDHGNSMEFPNGPLSTGARRDIQQYLSTMSNTEKAIMTCQIEKVVSNRVDIAQSSHHVDLGTSMISCEIDKLSCHFNQSKMDQSIPIPAVPSVPAFEMVSSPISRSLELSAVVSPIPTLTTVTPSTQEFESHSSSLSLSPIPSAPISDSITSIHFPTASFSIISNSFSSLSLSPTPSSPIISDSINSVTSVHFPNPSISNTISSMATTDDSIHSNSSLPSSNHGNSMEFPNGRLSTIARCDIQQYLSTMSNTEKAIMRCHIENSQVEDHMESSHQVKWGSRLISCQTDRSSYHVNDETSSVQADSGASMIPCEIDKSSYDINEEIQDQSMPSASSSPLSSVTSVTPTVFLPTPSSPSRPVSRNRGGSRNKKKTHGNKTKPRKHKQQQDTSLTPIKQSLTQDSTSESPSTHSFSSPSSSTSISNSISSIDFSPTPSYPIISDSISSITSFHISPTPNISNTVSSIASTDSNISSHSNVSNSDHDNSIEFPNGRLSTIAQHDIEKYLSTMSDTEKAIIRGHIEKSYDDKVGDEQSSHQNWGTRMISCEIDKFSYHAAGKTMEQPIHLIE